MYLVGGQPVQVLTRSNIEVVWAWVCHEKVHVPSGVYCKGIWEVVSQNSPQLVEVALSLVYMLLFRSVTGAQHRDLNATLGPGDLLMFGLFFFFLDYSQARQTGKNM